MKRNYQLGWRSRRLKIEVIHAKPIFRNVEILSVCPIVNGSRYFRVSGVSKDKDSVVMKIGPSKGKQNLEVGRRSSVPLGNLQRRVR